MGYRQIRLNPLQAVFFEWQRAEERRSETKGMNGGADVVQKTGQGQFGGPGAAADGVIAFKEEHGATGLSEADACGEAIWAGADHDRVVSFCHAREDSMADARGPVCRDELFRRC